MHPSTCSNQTPVILSVEDFGPARFLRSRLLRTAGFEVLEADSAESAMREVNTRTPQMALVDVDLPDGNGFTLCDALKRAFPSLPVVLISAVHISACARDTAFDTGADDYLIEPVPSELLVQRVTDALRGVQHKVDDTWVVTDAVGQIREASQVAAQLLGIGRRCLLRRSILVFFEHDRPLWQAALASATLGQIVRRSGLLRPRERRPLHVEVEIAAVADMGPGAYQWTFSSLRDPRFSRGERAAIHL